MGGLVSRQMIETGGAAPVGALVLAGTPSHGSPWPKVEDYLIAALSLGFNITSKLAWPGATLMKVLGMFTKLVEKEDVTLDEMNPASEFLVQLHGRDDPGIPYRVVIGDTSQIPMTSSDQSKIGALFERLDHMGLPIEELFGENRNDIAVRVDSATWIQWVTDEPRIVGCDHVT